MERRKREVTSALWSGTAANASASTEPSGSGGFSSSWCFTKTFFWGGTKSASSGTKPSLKPAVEQNSPSSSDVHIVAVAKSKPCACTRDAGVSGLEAPQESKKVGHRRASYTCSIIPKRDASSCRSNASTYVPLCVANSSRPWRVYLRRPQCAL